MTKTLLLMKKQLVKLASENFESLTATDLKILLSESVELSKIDVVIPVHIETGEHECSASHKNEDEVTTTTAKQFNGG